MTEAVARGASNPDIPGVAVQRLSPFEAVPKHVLGADAIILGTTENFGYMSGAMKDFFDRIYYPCLDETTAPPWTLFIRAWNDAWLADCEELGMTIAAGLEAGIF